MARRAKKDEPKRSQFLGLRLTDEEYIRLLKAADQAGMSVSEYARRQLASGKVVVRNEPAPIDHETFMQLRRIGTNLNQIAHAVNSDLPLPPEFRKVCTVIEDVVMRVVNHDRQSA